MLPAVFVMAQNVPQGPSPLVIGVYQGATNTAVKPGIAPQNVPQGPSPLVIVADEKTTNTATQTGIAAPNMPQGPLPLITGSYQDLRGTVAPQAEPSGTTGRVTTARTAFLVAAGAQYADEKEYKEAERAYLRALEANPENPDIRFLLSTLYIQMERYADAVRLLKKLAEEFPENPMLHNNLSWVYSTGGRMKNGKLALRHAREAILIEPYAPSLWNTLAEAYYVSGQYDKALRSSECAIDLLRLQPNVAEAELSTFETQRTKIQRANESHKRLLDLDREK